MRLFASILIIYFFMKSLYYGLYELNENKNKPAGIAVLLLSFLGLVLPLFLLIKYY